MAGLLGGYMDPQQMGLLGLASSLLAASGPSRTPISLGQAFGQGLLSGNQLQQQAAQMQMQSKLAQAKLDEAALKKQEVERQLERERQLSGLIGAPPKVPDNYVETATPGTGLIGGISSGDPNAMQNFNTGLLALGGDYTKMGLKGLGVGTDTPSSVSEFRYWQSLSPAEQEQYLRVKRAQQFLDVGSGFVAPGMTDPTRVTPVAPKQLKPGERPDVQRAQAAARASGEAEAEAQANLGSSIDEIQKMREDVSGLLSSPGFSTIYGASRYADPRNYLPGTEAANAEARREQLEAATFGISIQKMRGLGQLSDAEGKKVTAAYTRAINPKISEEEARKAWGEVMQHLELAERRVREKAGQRVLDLPSSGQSGGFKLLGRE